MKSQEKACKKSTEKNIIEERIYIE